MASTTSKPNDDSLDMASMKKLLLDTKVDGNKSLWNATLKTFGMADGKTKKGDINVSQMDQGLELIGAYVDELEKKDKNPVCWDLVPLEQFNATKEDFYLAFLHWATKEQDDGDDNKDTATINVSKAIRRMDDYFKWMNDNRKDLEEPLTVDSIREAFKCWDIQTTYDDQGHLLWWIDFNSIDKATVQKIANRDHLRYVVWFAHMVMFDPKCRKNGTFLFEDLAHVGFWKMATLVPHDLSAKMDRLTIGILPVRMKAIYVFGAATWMHIIMGLMKPFMGKKMRERMVIVSDKTDKQKFCDDKVTRKNIPKGFAGIEGEAARDVILESFSK